ncbi:MAG: hypothetical protein GY714_33085 [Desulfobacterales bacterium]|nr:hypothetical protein [Desulfobacterales bacterium]
MLVRKGQSMNQQISPEQNLLQFVIENGSIKGTRLLFDMGVKYDKNNHKYFLNAFYSGNPELLSLLIKKGFNPDVMLPGKKQSIMSYMAEFSRKNQNLEMMKLFLPRVDQWTTLMKKAIFSKKKEFQNYMNKNSNTIDKRNKIGQTALMLSAIYRKHQSVDLLVHKGASVNIKDDMLNTAFYYSVNSGVLESVKTILSKKPSLNSGSNNCFESLNKYDALEVARNYFYKGIPLKRQNVDFKSLILVTKLIAKIGNLRDVLNDNRIMPINRAFVKLYGPDQNEIYELLKKIQNDPSYPSTNICKKIWVVKKKQ